MAAPVSALAATSVIWAYSPNAGNVTCETSLRVASLTITFGADFPYAGMLDDTLNPTFDLSFAQPKAIYYGLGSTTYTNGNLFNRYWKKTIEEITDKDSKIIKGKFRLNEVEFSNLSFRKIYLLDKQWAVNSS